MTAAHPLEQRTLTRFRLLMLARQVDRAEEVLHHALALEPNLPKVHLTLASLRWPGPGYRHWLAWLHKELRPGLYVEIGVEKGESLALARPPTRVLGVDPAPVGDPLANCPTQARVYRQTSAEFLRSPPVDCGLRTGGFDLAFIDGDHRFENVLNDFIGLESWAAPGAMIVLHDTLPLTALTASQERKSGFYSGDGWKIVRCLSALRPELELVTLPVAPTGLTLVAGLDPHKQVLRERRQDILASYVGVDASRAVERPEAVMWPLGINDPVWVKCWLRRAGVRFRS